MASDGSSSAPNASDSNRLAELVRSSRGQWPADIVGHRPQGLSLQVGNPIESVAYTPDLSLIRGEWYFSSATARDLASLASGRILFAGTPTLAALVPKSTLIESSPWARERVNLTHVEHLEFDFEEYWADDRYDFIAFDPPWYYPALINWINNAAFFSHRGSRIAFPLFGEGTRPGADTERDRILEYCRTIGTVRLERDLVSYDTPLFEECALRASGLQVRGQWRRSDLVILKVNEPTPSLKSIREPFQWDEVRIGDRIFGIKKTPVRRPAHARDENLIAPAAGVANWVLNSVSRRDLRWTGINVWDSWNRVAYTPDTKRILKLLRMLAQGERGTDDLAGMHELQTWLGDSE